MAFLLRSVRVGWVLTSQGHLTSRPLGAATRAFAGAPYQLKRLKDVGGYRKEDHKSAKTVQREKAVDVREQGEANFFWECVRHRQRGGALGKGKGATALELFGDRALAGSGGGDRTGAEGPIGGGASGATSAAGVMAKVTRGGGAETFGVGELTSFTGAGGEEFARLVPSFCVANLVGRDRMAYSAPSPIQSHTVPLALAGHDVLGSAQTGSGKTIAFLLPLLANVARRRAAEAEAAAKTEANAAAVAFPVKGSGRNGAAEKGKVVARPSPAAPAALILAPTRELALQIEREIEKLTFGAPLTSLSSSSGSSEPKSSPASLAPASRWSVAVYGGANARPQLEALAGGAEVVVATPGRLADFLSRRPPLLSLKRCGFLVLDEADRMLDMGFAPQLASIVDGGDMPSRGAGRQTLLFSATFPPDLQREAARSYLRPGHAVVAVGAVGAGNADVEQRVVCCGGTGTKQDKLAALLHLLEAEEVAAAESAKAEGRKQAQQRTIVFVNKKHHAAWVASKLTALGFSVGEVHSDRSQGQREAALGKFRSGEASVLVATDAVARGIDVDGVGHVVQFDLPVSAKDFEAYTHRIGRTGRAGRPGVATAIFVPGTDPKLGNGELWPLLAASLRAQAAAVAAAQGTAAAAAAALPAWFLAQGEASGLRSWGSAPTLPPAAAKKAPAAQTTGRGRSPEPRALAAASSSRPSRDGAAAAASPPPARSPAQAPARTGPAPKIDLGSGHDGAPMRAPASARPGNTGNKYVRKGARSAGPRP